jgi:hypothetical protein
MNQFDQLQYIDLFNGMNTSPIPLEFSNEMTTLKIMAALQAKVNSIIDFRNNAVSDANSYTDEQKALIDKSIQDLNTSLTQTINSLPNNAAYMSTLIQTVTNVLSGAAKFVNFGLDDKGYFYADIPDSWNEITFSSDSEGHLILEY